MWKEKENDSMDEGAQEDEQFEMEIDNGKTVRSESEDGEEDDDCWKCGSDPNRVAWVSGTLVQGQQAKDQVRKMRNRLARHSKIKFGKRGIGHEKKQV